MMINPVLTMACLAVACLIVVVGFVTARHHGSAQGQGGPSAWTIGALLVALALPLSSAAVATVTAPCTGPTAELPQTARALFPAPGEPVVPFLPEESFSTGSSRTVTCIDRRAWELRFLPDPLGIHAALEAMYDESPEGRFKGFNVWNPIVLTAQQIVTLTLLGWPLTVMLVGVWSWRTWTRRPDRVTEPVPVPITR